MLSLFRFSHTDQHFRPTFSTIEPADDPDVIEQLLNLLAEPENKFTTLLNQEYLNSIHGTYRDGTSSIHVLDETVAPLIAGQQFKEFDPLKKTFDEKFSRLYESGLINKLHERNSLKEEEIGPEILTMDHIGIGFLCCIAPLMIALGVFFLEIEHKAVKKVLKNITESIVAYTIITVFISTKNKHTNIRGWV